MGFQCVPQITGIQRKAGKARKTKDGKVRSIKGTHRTQGPGVLYEMMEERASKSEMLHRDYSDQNVMWSRCDSTRSADIWQDMLDEVVANPVVRKDGRTAKLRDNGVLAAAVVINPPEEVTMHWTPAQYDKFMRDAQESLAAIDPSLAGEMISCSDHLDEWNPDNDEAVLAARRAGFVAGKHRHYVSSCHVDGRWVGNNIDALLMQKVNAQFPAMMRERGWDVDDPDRTDYKRYNTDKAYHDKRKAELEAKREAGTGGLSPNEYRRRQKLKKLDDEADKARERAEAEQDRAAAASAALKAATDSLALKRQQVELEEEARAEAEREKDEEKAKLDTIKYEKARLRREKDEEKAELDTIKYEKARLQREIDAAKARHETIDALDRKIGAKRSELKLASARALEADSNFDFLGALPDAMSLVDVVELPDWYFEDAVPPNFRLSCVKANDGTILSMFKYEVTEQKHVLYAAVPEQYLRDQETALWLPKSEDFLVLDNVARAWLPSRIEGSDLAHDLRTFVHDGELARQRQRDEAELNARLQAIADHEGLSGLGGLTLS